MVITTAGEVVMISSGMMMPYIYEYECAVVLVVEQTMQHVLYPNGAKQYE